MTHSTARNRSQLESLWQHPAVVRKPSSASPTADILRQWAQDLLAFLTGSQQLRIWTKSTKQGVKWFAYDPASDQRIADCSEDDLRVWLESRYHH